MISRETSDNLVSRNGQRDEEARALRAPSSSCSARRRRFLSKRGSQILEYAIVIAAIAGAFTFMFVYGKRGLQGVVKRTLDTEVGTQVESAPLEGSVDNEMSVSRADTLSYDNGHITKNASGVFMETESYSSTTGISNSASQ